MIEERLKGKGNYELWMPDCEVPSAEAIVNQTGERWRARKAGNLTQRRHAALAPGPLSLLSAERQTQNQLYVPPASAIPLDHLPIWG
jgi:hypothetical protein